MQKEYNVNSINNNLDRAILVCADKKV